MLIAKSKNQFGLLAQMDRVFALKKLSGSYVVLTILLYSHVHEQEYRANIGAGHFGGLDFHSVHAESMKTMRK
jgi:hypothetical protein